MCDGILIKHQSISTKSANLKETRCSFRTGIKLWFPYHSFNWLTTLAWVTAPVSSVCSFGVGQQMIWPHWVKYFSQIIDYFYPSIHPSIHFFIHPFTNLFNFPSSFLQFFHSSTHPSFHPFIHPFIHTISKCQPHARHRKAMNKTDTGPILLESTSSWVK